MYGYYGKLFREYCGVTLEGFRNNKIQNSIRRLKVKEKLDGNDTK